MRLNTNMVIITGNVTRDATLRYTAAQKPVLGFTVACNRQGPEGQSVADFFPVVVWGKTAEAIEKFIVKGKGVLVKGHLQTREYEAKTGEKKQVTEIVADNFGGVELLGGGERAQGGGQYQQPPSQGYGQAPRSQRQGWPPLEIEQATQRPESYQQGNVPF